MAIQPKYVVIDSNIGADETDLKLFQETLGGKAFRDKKLLLLQFAKANDRVKAILKSNFDYDTINLENKAKSCDIQSIFEFFSIKERVNITKATDRIRFGKQILYLDAVSDSFIRKFESNPECPGFWNLAVGTFCIHGCRYCFLNLTMRVRPVCVEHANLSHLEANLKNFNRRFSNPQTLLNAGESSDPLDNEPLLHFWNRIVEIVQKSGNGLLCLTKSANVYSIPEADGHSLKGPVIYSWSINPQKVVLRYEPNTASTQERLEAAQHLKKLGYPIRFRIDPILPLNLMQALTEGLELPLEEIELEDYFSLIDKFTSIEPEMITFGTFRALPTLFNFLKDTTLNKKSFVKNGKRFRMPIQYRKYIYEKLGVYARDLLNCHIAICKDPTIDLPFSTLKGPCQCMKTEGKLTP